MLVDYKGDITMNTKQLRAYMIEFYPIVNGIPRPVRKVQIVAYSQKQANKFFYDWRHNTKKVPAIFVMSYEIEQPKELTPQKWQEEIVENFIKQQNIIYGKEVKNDNNNTGRAS